MLDLFYVVIAVVFFAACWQLTKACDKNVKGQRTLWIT